MNWSSFCFFGFATVVEVRSFDLSILLRITGPPLLLLFVVVVVLAVVVGNGVVL